MTRSHDAPVTPNVLLLDDDAAFRGLVRPALEARGLAVLEARKGREALQLLATGDPSVIVVDGLLPDTTGLRWIEKVREQGVTLPIVFVSAFYRDLDSYKRLKEQLACAEVLYKPLSPDDLAARVSALAHVSPERREHDRQSVLEIDLSEIDGLDEPDDEALSEDVLVEPTYDTTQNAARSYDELVAAYRKSLPRQLERAVAACAAARAHPTVRAEVREAIRHVHDLAGSAASFGFESVGHAGASLESELRRLEAGETPEWTRFDEAVAVLRANIALAPEVTQVGVALPETSSHLLGPRLLVVDDDPALVDYFTGALAQTLASFVACASTDALGHTDLSSIEAAFVSMPFEDVLGAGRAIERIRAQRPDVPIAVLALEDSFEVREEAMATGADLFLAHPVDDRDLRRALLRLDAMRVEGLRVAVLAAPDLSAELRERGLEVREHADASSLLACFVRERPHVVVAGGDEQLAAVRTVRMADGGDETAILALAGGGIDALTAGADAIVPLGASRADVVMRFARRVASRRARGIDVASGLPARAELLDLLHAKLGETRRRARAFTLAVIEIRDYDSIAAREGTGFGERLVGAVGRLLATRFRLEDARGRWRGGTLVAGFAEADAATMAPAVRRFQSEVRQLAFHGDVERVKVVVDVGLASAPTDGDDLRTLVLAAEARLGRAPRSEAGGLAFS
ncbi:MAG: response regulator [Sandaracinus sp.]|nr:response regulator [Sandaracinus sp.]